MNWKRPLSRAGFLGALAAGGYFAADQVSQGSAIRRACSTIIRTVTVTVTEPPPAPPPPPPPPPPVPLGGNLPALLPASTGTVKYVATTGNDTTGDGSQANPWASFQKLLSTLTAGQVGEMAAGVYNAPVGNPNGRNSLTARSGTSANPIEIRAATGATVQIRPTASSPHEAFVATEGSSYWRFRDLIFENAGSGSNYQNVYLADNVAGCHDIEFWNCEMRNTAAGSGVFVEEGCSRIYFVNCRSHDNQIVVAQNQAHGFYITGDNCMLINCIAYNQDGFGFQIRTNDTDGPNRVIVANCVAYNCKPVAAPGNEYAGFMAESKADDCQFWNNITYSNRNGFRGLQAGQVPSTANIARKNIAYANTDASYVNNNLTNWVFDFDGAGNHGPADTNQNIPVGDNIHQDPLLTDPANGVFTLQSGSPAIGYGNPDWCPPFDYLGRARSQVDAGAYAFNPLGPQGVPGDAIPNTRATWQPFMYEKKRT